MMIRLTSYFFILLLVASIGTLWLVTTEGRLVPEFSGDIDSSRFGKLIKRLDPRSLETGNRRNLVLTETELQQLVQHELQRSIGGAVRIGISPGMVQVLYSHAIPLLPVRRYFNFNLLIKAEQGLPVLQSLKVGQHQLSRSMANRVMQFALDLFYEKQGYQQLLEVIEEFEPGNGQLKLVYLWNPDLVRPIHPGQSWEEFRQTLLVYQDFLATLVADERAAKVSLKEIMEPMFLLAETRAQSNNAVAENRALLITLAAWAKGHRVNPVLRDETVAEIRPKFKLRLRGRRDTARHFVISAAIAANGGSALSDALGTYKELADADQGSGFSFTDIAAGLSGTRFGEQAVDSSSSAEDLQQLMVDGLPESAYMPSLQGLAEHLSSAEFEKKYQHVGSPRYQNVLTDIRLRIDQCQLYSG